MDVKNMFFSPQKRTDSHVSPQTPIDHLRNLGCEGREDSQGLRHVAANTLIDLGGKDRTMVYRCLGD